MAAASKIVAFPGTSSSPSRGGGQGSIAMRSDLVEEASKIFPEPPVLINLVSRRVKQLNQGRTPLIEVEPRMGSADIALQEIIEGKVVPEYVEEEEA